ncbi:MAG: hypothetical protein ABI862_08310 [Ilumatobacteraceae bacterium]
MSRSGHIMVAAFAAIALISGCGEASDDAAQNTFAAPISSAPSMSSPDTSTTAEPLLSSPLTVVADPEEATVPSSPDLAPSLQRLVNQAIADLATLLSVDASTISTVSAKSVTWPDGSLGCPQSGMNYTQVTVDGALIELAVDGTTYRYHSGGSRSPFLCHKT